MQLVARSSGLVGSVAMPGSKSHTIRAVAIAALADGRSVIEAPLVSADAAAAVRAYRALGARIDDAAADRWVVDGVAGRPHAAADAIDVANSGTSLNVALGSAALLAEGSMRFTGDEQIQRRPVGPLARSLGDLGAAVTFERDTDAPPLTVTGRLSGGQTTLQARNSQYLTSLLINCPLADGPTTIDLAVLFERPYVQMTLDWLSRTGIAVDYADFNRFVVPGSQRYQPFERRMPADFSSATFFIAAAAVGDNDVHITGLDLADTQGDKAVVDHLRAMGATIDATDAGLHVRGGPLTGTTLDLNATPDALPMLAVVACFARGTTRLTNVAHARIKETDRIAAMAAELAELGARIEEQPDGLVIHPSDLRGGRVDGRGDHRIVMSLAMAGCLLPPGAGALTIDTAEAIHVTFPTFIDCVQALGGDVEAMS